MKKTLFVLVVSLSVACAKTPPNLSPAGQKAFKATQVIQTLDLLRDAAINASQTVPPLISVDVTRKVVLYHQSAIKVVNAGLTGWQDAVNSSLDELVKNLPSNDKNHLAAYIAFVKSILAEVSK